MRRFLTLILLITMTSAIQAQETKLFTSNMVTIMRKSAKGEWVVEKTKEGYTAIIYGPNYIQVGSDEKKLRFTLYGKVEKTKIDGGDMVTQNGFTPDGDKMQTSTVYWLKTKKVSVGIQIGDVMFIYELDPF